MTPPTPHKAGFALIALAIGLASFSLTMLFLSAAYTHDLGTLAAAPFEIWSALCGQPSNTPLVLPLLVAFSVLALLASATLLATAYLQSRKH